MAERAGGICPLAKPIAHVLREYGERMGGGNTSQRVADALENGGMSQGIAEFLKVCNDSGRSVAEEMNLAEDVNAQHFLSFLHLTAALPLTGLCFLGDGGIALARKISAIKIRLPQASSAAPAVDWTWTNDNDGTHVKP